MPGKLVYLKGDATYPEKYLERKDEIKVIIHVCNDIDKWGRGFVLALSKRWSKPKISFHSMKKELGTISICPIEQTNICVVNMMAQRGIYKQNGIEPIRYGALETCLKEVAKTFKDYVSKVSIHLPRIGCGLAGGNWGIVQGLIEKNLVEKGYTVCV
uniref:Macro domain-containing protein n=1 Tax=Pithovirus LCPAC403 TaxID=2506596 RepID=A0A481ZAZ5_9VIRU|nr:MAG: hypothetical protein LCPAC403_02280 [Pithovirus LCPAC403]